MKKNGRVKNSIFNTLSGLTNRALSVLISFIVRTVFIKCLSADYLGINGLYTSILTMLSLAELGFGTAMVFSMYKPLAENDQHKLQQLMKLYKTVYSIIGTFILVVGLILVPFLKYLIKDPPDVEGITFYYILFLLNTVFSYWFFAYRNSLLQADQKAYVINNVSTISNILKSIVQIILLLVFHNYTVYLITQILFTILQNIWLALKVRKTYPWIRQNCKDRISKKERNRIFKDVKALMINKVSHVVLNATDNIIISSFVGIKWVGILSNFTLIVDAITSVLTQITSSFSASLGNYFASEDNESGYILFRRVEFLNFWLYGFSSISLLILLNPFVTLWVGENYTLDNFSVVALSINFFVAGFMNTLWTFRSTLGLFVQGQYRALVVAFLNIVLSIALSYPFGVAGVLIATSISRALVNLWYDPLILHKYGFNKSVKSFYLRYLFRIILLVLVSIIMIFVSKEVIFRNGVTLLNFVIMCLIILVFVNFIFAIIFMKTDEFKYFYNFIRDFLKKKILKK